MMLTLAMAIADLRCGMDTWRPPTWSGVFICDRLNPSNSYAAAWRRDFKNTGCHIRLPNINWDEQMLTNVYKCHKCLDTSSSLYYMYRSPVGYMHTLVIFMNEIQFPFTTHAHGDQNLFACTLIKFTNVALRHNLDKLPASVHFSLLSANKYSSARVRGAVSQIPKHT